MPRYFTRGPKWSWKIVPGLVKIRFRGQLGQFRSNRKRKMQTQRGYSVRRESTQYRERTDLVEMAHEFYRSVYNRVSSSNDARSLRDYHRSLSHGTHRRLSQPYELFNELFYTEANDDILGARTTLHKRTQSSNGGLPRPLARDCGDNTASRRMWNATMRPER